MRSFGVFDQSRHRVLHMIDTSCEDTTSEKQQRMHTSHHITCLEPKLSMPQHPYRLLFSTTKAVSTQPNETLSGTVALGSTVRTPLSSGLTLFGPWCVHHIPPSLENRPRGCVKYVCGPATGFGNSFPDALKRRVAYLAGQGCRVCHHEREIADTCCESLPPLPPPCLPHTEFLRDILGVPADS